MPWFRVDFFSLLLINISILVVEVSLQMRSIKIERFESRSVCVKSWTMSGVHDDEVVLKMIDL